MKKSKPVTRLDEFSGIHVHIHRKDESKPKSSINTYELSREFLEFQIHFLIPKALIILHSHEIGNKRNRDEPKI